MMSKMIRVIFILVLLYTLPGFSGTLVPGVTSIVQAEPLAAVNHAIYLPGTLPPSSGFDLSGKIEIPYSSQLNFNGGALTITAWINRDTLARAETILGNGWQESYWFGFTPTGNLRFTPDGFAHHADSTATIPAGKWTHVAVVFKTGTTRFYINGALDTTVNQAGAALVAAPAGSLLYIGYDRNNTFSPNYFAGYIDEVHLSKSDLSQQIQLFLQESNNIVDPNQRAHWSLEGNANDNSGQGHHGIIRGGGATFTNYAAFPKNLLIPQVAAVPVLNGDCGTTEYTNAVTVSIFDTPVAIQHTASDLWVCFDYLGTSSAASVYLDPQLTRVDPSQPEHLRLSVTNANTRTTGVGNGAGNYTTTPGLDIQWDGKYLSSGGEFPTYSAEFRISSALLGGLEHQIGLALDTDAAGRGGLSLWPILAGYSLPSTWSLATLAGLGPVRIFNGTVKYQPKNSAYSASPVGGVALNVIGSNPDGSEAVVSSGKSNSSGVFSIGTTSSFSNQRLVLGSPPQGLVYQKAVAGPSGTMLDERTIDFATAGSGTYPSNQFVLADALPANLDSGHGPIYEIIAAQAIFDSGALDDFMIYKSRLGFTIETKSLESIDSGMPGANRKDRIRAWEKNRRAAYAARFAYVLLVGSQETIPHIRVAFGMDNKSGNTCADVNSGVTGYKESDWYYVDLVSNFDTNGNGCYLDGMWTKAADLAPGYSPDAIPGFEFSVTLGRIPFDSASTIKKVLKNSMDFERQSKAYKTQALFGMSMLALEGYMPNGSPCADQWGNRCVPPDPNSNYDMAMLVEQMKTNFFTPLGYTSTSYYENEATVAGGSGIHSAQVLNENTIEAALNQHLYGFVDFDGHGNGSGVYRVHWTGDLNGNGVMNLSNTPALNEVAGGDLFRNDNLANLTADNAMGAIFYVMACSTADPDKSNNFAASILSGGHGVATIAAMSVIGVGSWTGPISTGSVAQHDNYFIAQRIFSQNQLVGDALWGTLSERLKKNSHGSGQLAISLFGDPSLSYQGNPSAGSRLAPWSMLRREVNGRAYFPLSGPALPKKLWEYSASAPTPNIPRPSPVVSADGEVTVAAGSTLRVLRNGTLFQTLNLDAQAYGSPALAADGTLYSVDVNGKIYAFSYPQVITLYPAQRSRRWAYPTGGAPLTSPSIAPDGSILVGSEYSGQISVLTILRPDGNLHNINLLSGKIQAAVSATADRIIYAATLRSDNGQGTLYRLDPYCLPSNSTCSAKSITIANGYSGAPLLSYGDLFVGSADGNIYRYNPETLSQLNVYNAGSPITAGPVAGPGGQILVGTFAGKYISLTTNLALRWQHAFADGPINGVPAFSTDGLYITTSNRLTALNPTSGAILWQRFQAAIGNGSAAVGYGREVYFQTESGKVLAYGEGWVNPPVYVIARADKIGQRAVNQVSWYINGAPPIPLSADPQPVPEEAVDINAVTTVMGVLLQRSPDGNEWEDVALLPPGTTSFTDTGITPQTGYQYRLQIIDSSGQNSDFAISEAIDSLPSLPGSPVLTAVTPLSSSTLSLQWNAPASLVDQYRIERGGSAGGPFNPLGTIDSTSTSFADDTLGPNARAFYRVVALNQTGESTPSNVIGATTFQQGLAGPQNLQAVLLNGKITLTWNGRPPSAQAAVEMLPFGSSDWTPLASLNADTFGYFPGEPNAYDFRVKFVQGLNESSYAQTSSSLVIPQNLLTYLPMLER
jgi:hypothetical protein